MKQLNFGESLLSELMNKKAASTEEDIVVNANEDSTNAPLSPLIIKHWLNFAIYYERAAVSFIGGWMRTIYEDDALIHFAHQIEDEANHYRWLKNHYKNYSDLPVEEFQPPVEWKFLMEEYYPSLSTLIERLAAHNLAAEMGALGFAEYYFERLPSDIKTTMSKVIKDERYHISFGTHLLNKYCITDEQKNMARVAAQESLEHMKSARSVFVKI